MSAYFPILLLSLICSLASPASPQQLMNSGLRVEDGSIPPMGGAFDCVKDLDGKPYSSQLVQSCLQSLKRVPYVRSAEVHSNNLKDGNIFIEFAVKAKVLPIVDIGFTAPQSEAQQLQLWLAKNSNNLRVGDPYSPSAESSTYQGIKQYYLTRGLLVGIVPTVRLDYSKGTASVNFEIIRGPDVPKKQAYFPYGNACDDEVTYIDWSDVDSFVPVPLIESQLRLGALGACYSVDAAKHDEETLTRIGIFDSETIDLSGPKDARHISLKLRGKQLSVEEVKIRGFGPNSSCAENREKDVALKPAQTYTSDSASKSLEYLRSVCTGPRQWVEVTETDQLTANGRLRVYFNVLVFPLQTVIVDGQELESHVSGGR